MGAANYKNQFIFYKGKRLTYNEVAAMRGMHIEGVRKRFLAGWTPEEMVETPKGRTPDRILEQRMHEGRTRSAKTEQGKRLREEIKKKLEKEYDGIFDKEMSFQAALAMKWVKG